jgi:murein DD-endopeptidase MepM/ murein hydrolase activator NlpD
VACPQKDKGPAPVRDGPLGAQRCSGQPGPRARLQPVFQRPFDGQYPVFNLFDHDLPKRGTLGPEIKEDQELTYCGVQSLGLIDGYRGYAFATPIGTPILAPADGEVEEAGLQEPFACPITMRVVDNQLSVSVRHDTLGGVGYKTRFSHLQKILVKAGDKVVAGQRIALSGSSGCAAAPVTGMEVLRLTGTSTGSPVVVDPYGWDGVGVDPWSKHPEGSESLYLWKTGEAPTLRSR